MIILPVRRGRWLELRASRKGRERLTGSLYHLDVLDPRWIVSVPPAQDTADDLAAELERRGAGKSCWVWSADRAVQGVQNLRQALDALMCREAALVLCVPGRLGCYLGEDLRSRLILDRRA